MFSMKPMAALSAPSGVPLVNQALRYAAATVREFQPLSLRQVSNPAEFSLMGCLAAIGRSHDVGQRVRALVAVQEFLRAPENLRRRFRTQIREMVTAGDMPSGANMQAYIDRFLITPGEMDVGYEQIFMVHDVAQSEAQLLKGEFKVLNVTSGVTFAKRVPGEPVSLKSITGAEVSTPYDMVGGGVSIEGVWWDDQDYLLIADVITLFREAYYFKRAQDFYALITGLSAAINYSTGADLIAKMNGAAAVILRAVQGKGYKATADVEFVVLFSPENAGAVYAALQTITDVAMQTSVSKTKLHYKFRPVMSVHVGAADGPYVILPKGQLKGGYRMDLTLFGRFDPTSYADDIAGFGRYAGIVGDTMQIKRIT